MLTFPSSLKFMETDMLEIKVLGPGCANCSKLEQITRKAVSEMGFEADIDKITDYGEIMSYPIISTPGLVINGDVVCSGRVPTQAEVTTWLVNAEG
jgi:small redox-active disulfide protein 2